MIKIFLADDHEMVRQGIRTLLEKDPDIRVTAQGGSGKETLAQLTAVRPDLLILDIKLPDMSGLKVLEKAKKVLPALPVIILSMYDDKVHLIEALQKGAAGYVIKGSPGSELLQAVRAVTAGRRYISQSLAGYLMESVSPARSKNGEEDFERLTLREEQVLQFTAEGLSSSEIAAHLGISARTVEAHRGNLMRKLGFHKKAELIRYAMGRHLAIEQ